MLKLSPMVLAVGFIDSAVARVVVAAKWQRSKSQKNAACSERYSHGWRAFLITTLFDSVTTSQEPVLVPPLRLHRLTASTIKVALDAWMPLTASKQLLDRLELWNFGF